MSVSAGRVEIPYPHRRAGHCGSGAFRDLLEFHGLSWTDAPLSEGMAFGLGAGLGFAYVELPGSSRRSTSWAARPGSSATPARTSA